jgi:hypothetical protein
MIPRQAHQTPHNGYGAPASCMTHRNLDHAGTATPAQSFADERMRCFVLMWRNSAIGLAVAGGRGAYFRNAAIRRGSSDRARWGRERQPG